MEEEDENDEPKNEEPTVSVKRLSNIFRETVTNLDRPSGSGSSSVKRGASFARKLNVLPVVVIEEKKALPPNPHRSRPLVDRTSSIDWERKFSKPNHRKSQPEEEVSGEEESILCERSGSLIGVRNKVRNTMALLFQSQAQTKAKEHRVVEKRKVVVYVTTNGIVRGPFQQCLRVRTILATHRVAFEERNIFVQGRYLAELRERLAQARHAYYEYAGLEFKEDDDDEEYPVNGPNGVPVPQVFVEGRHLGGAERIESLNESGQLKTIMKDFKSSWANAVCAFCGNYRVLVCDICKGSKKSPVRNNNNRNYYFQLRCTNCDENGLVPCKRCSSPTIS